MDAVEDNAAIPFAMCTHLRKSLTRPKSAGAIMHSQYSFGHNLCAAKSSKSDRPVVDPSVRIEECRNKYRETAVVSECVLSSAPNFTCCRYFANLRE